MGLCVKICVYCKTRWMQCGNEMELWLDSYFGNIYSMHVHRAISHNMDEEVNVNVNECSMNVLSK